MVLPIAEPNTRKASLSSGVGMLPTSGSVQPPTTTVAQARTPRQARLDAPDDLRRCEIEPPISSTQAPNTHGMAVSCRPAPGLKPRPSIRYEVNQVSPRARPQ